MVPRDADKSASPKIPVVDEERCIGCDACEYPWPSAQRGLREGTRKAQDGLKSLPKNNPQSRLTRQY
jgi:ferredoxin